MNSLLVVAMHLFLQVFRCFETFVKLISTLDLLSALTVNSIYQGENNEEIREASTMPVKVTARN